jgi:hypothetical protein
MIIEYETLGEWGNAITCHELGLESNRLDTRYNQGLETCLLKLGHYDTLFLKSPDPNPITLEASWRVGDWDRIRSLSLDKAPSKFMALLAFGLCFIRDRNHDGYTKVRGMLDKVVAVEIVAGSVESQVQGLAEADMVLSYEFR